MMYRKTYPLFFLVLMLSACTGGSGEEVADTIPAQIFIFPGDQEKRLISQETIELPNCTGNAETSQTVQRSHTLLYTLELGSEITVSADGRAGIPGIGEVGVGTEVAANYQVGYGRSETISRAQTVAAAPQSHMQHTIQQFEIWETGELLIVVGETNTRLPYSFRRDFSIEAVAPANIGCSGSNNPPADDVVPSVSPEANNPSSGVAVEGPFIEHSSTSAGTGVFSNVTYSDGLAEYTQDWLLINQPKIQRIRREEFPDGCDIAYYDAQKLWVGGTPGMRLTINGEEVGEYRIAPDFHGFILNQTVEIGDRVCAVNFGSEGFVIIFGPDIYYHYDSYCYRVSCPGN